MEIILNILTLFLVISLSPGYISGIKRTKPQTFVETPLFC